MNRLSVNQLVVLRRDRLVQNVTAAAFFECRALIRFALLLLRLFFSTLQCFFDRLELSLSLVLLGAGQSKVIKCLEMFT